MRKISPMISANVSSKILKPVLIVSGAAVVFVSLLLVQQNNINSLDLKIGKLSARIVQASSIDERLKLEKDVVGFEKDKTIIQNGAYTNLVQALGGLVLSMTAWVGYQNFRVGEKNLKVSEDKQVTERFSKSIEHLGNSNQIDIRLGGIYALEQIAIDSAKYHWTIVEILSAFVREKCPLVNIAPPAGNLEPTSLEEQSEQKTSVPTPKKVGVDIQAAMTVLGRRKVAQDPSGKNIDLRSVNLPFIEIQEASLRGANLIGANLSEANLSKADLSKASLRGANLSKADLIGADLSKADLIRASLRGANLSKADLIGADLIGANLIGANLIGADLSEANLIGADLTEANLIGAFLIGADLTEAFLRKADLTGANLSKANLSKASLRGANLIGADLSEANLSKANLSKADLIRASLRGANLSKADLIGADLSEANLIGAFLIGADLTEANLSKADLTGANLSKANLTGANLTGAELIYVTVQNTRFGNNLGISDDMKKELEGKGAIFRDSPSI
jgi:uncharacterized protein YjbI with pentapeptide repeats